MITIKLIDGLTETVEATIVGSLACHDDVITHVATGLQVCAGNLDLAKRLNKDIRWTWANQQPFGVTLRGRGATILKRNIETCLTSI